MLDLWWGEVGGGANDTIIQPPPPPLPPPPLAPPPPPPPPPSSSNEEGEGWSAFPSQPTAPLTHLETLTHSTFLNKSEMQKENTIQLSDIGSDVSLPPPTPWFPCPQCGKSFRTRITLSRHEKIHKGNAFPCPLCPKVFYQVSNVKYHVHAVHGRQYETPVRGGSNEAATLP